MKRLQIGQTKKIQIPGKKLQKYTYKDVEHDEGGWVDASKYLPLELELVVLKLEKKKKMGWRSSTHWDGIYVKPDEKVLYWKRVSEKK